jgi:hypothetical protein
MIDPESGRDLLRRPPHRRISRPTVERCRPNARAISASLSPRQIPTKIRSRSSNDNRCDECPTRRRINAASSRIRHADVIASPNSAITSFTCAPARNLATIARRSVGVNSR